MVGEVLYTFKPYITLAKRTYEFANSWLTAIKISVLNGIQLRA